ncbi:hypothetical protein K0504_09600 [Neiella marina]|uniref:Conjugal transfer protein n=1 Tax=Neiella holothuriorum TaxID=2870530 RepID=A0ABS7EG49_9GAMM|nr:TrbC family F-type conjugative pilus assembly protein [Neiella holothuriorum]MBW8191290.1 hypothetical protein [Neiella holothuriorum]
MYCFSRLALIGLVLATPTVANEPIVDQIATQQQLIKDATERAQQEGWLEGFDGQTQQAIAKPYVEDATELAKQGGEATVTAARHYFEEQIQGDEDVASTKPRPKEPEAKVDLDIFVSLGMPRAELKTALELASQLGARVLFQGWESETNSPIKTIGMFKKLAADLEVEPIVQLAPKKFERGNVEAVPTMIYRADGLTFKVAGTLAAEWLISKSEGAQSSLDLGVVGATYDIDETNLIDLARQRYDAIDWKAKQRQAYERFWKHQTFHFLPDAVDSRDFWIDPTMRVTSDIVDVRGNTLAAKGQVINPLLDAPYQLNIVVFDATNPQQTEWAQRQVRTYTKGKVIAVTTKVNRDDGWQHLSDTRKTLGLDVKKLSKQMIDAFQLKAVPSVITTENTYIHVHEVGQKAMREQLDTEVNP